MRLLKLDKAVLKNTVFPSLQPSVLALSIVALEIEEQKLLELAEALEFLQLHSKVCADKVSEE